MKILPVVYFGAFLFSNSFFSIHVALPAIQEKFQTGLAAVQWIGIMGLVVISTLSLYFWPRRDLIGRVKLYKIGVLLYALGSAACALASSFPQLLIFRVIMVRCFPSRCSAALPWRARSFPFCSVPWSCNRFLSWRRYSWPNARLFFFHDRGCDDRLAAFYRTLRPGQRASFRPG